MPDPFTDSSSFIRHVSRKLYQGANGPRMFHDGQVTAVTDSAVMLLLGNKGAGCSGKKRTLSYFKQTVGQGAAGR